MPVSAQESRVAVGLLNATGYTTGFSITDDSVALPVSTLADRAAAFIVGQTEWNASIDMILDVSGAANGQFDAAHDWKSVEGVPVTFGPPGLAAGDQVLLGDSLLTQIATSSEVSGVVEAQATFQGTNALDVGVAIEDFRAVTADGNGTGQDNGASTANGGVAHIHVTAFSGLTSDAITIEHDSDSGFGTAATLVTFTTVTGLTSQRVVVAAGTTVNRYLRVVDNVTGTGSITRQVSFARR